MSYKMNMPLNYFVQMSVNLQRPLWWAATRINHWQGARTCAKGIRKASRYQMEGKSKDKRQRHWRTNQPWSRGGRAGSDRRGCRVGAEGRGALIDWVWQLLISYQLHLWGKALGFSPAVACLMNRLPDVSVKGLALNQTGCWKDLFHLLCCRKKTVCTTWSLI